MENGEKTKSKAFSFFTLSTLFHIALAVGIAHLTYKASQKLPKVTEVEFMAPAEASAEAGLADVQAPPVQTASAPVEKAEPSVVSAASEPQAATTEVEPVAELPKAKPKAKSAAKAVQPPSQKAVVKAQEPVVEQPAEEAPQVEATPVAEAEEPAAPEQKPEEPKVEVTAAVPVETQPANEDTKPEIDTQAQQAELDQMTDKYKADADEQFKQAEKDLAESQMAEARALEEQAAKDKAAAEAAKQAEADQAAKAAAAAQAASVAPQSSGGEKPQTAQAGNGSEPVRAVADLKQMPGNKKPAYDVADRKAGRAGEVIFTAYVTKAGTLSDFKLVKSSGHRSLDAKTLAALKTWKFQPNQEGRTELGFKWDLKGEAVEMPATLRR